MNPIEEYELKLMEVKKRFLNAKGFHQRYGEGTIILAGLSHGLAWVEVKFTDRSKVFVEPFEKLLIT